MPENKPGWVANVFDGPGSPNATRTRSATTVNGPGSAAISMSKAVGLMRGPRVVGSPPPARKKTSKERAEGKEGEAKEGKEGKEAKASKEGKEKEKEKEKVAKSVGREEGKKMSGFASLRVKKTSTPELDRKASNLVSQFDLATPAGAAAPPVRAHNVL